MTSRLLQDFPKLWNRRSIWLAGSAVAAIAAVVAVRSLTSVDWSHANNHADALGAIAQPASVAQPDSVAQPANVSHSADVSHSAAARIAGSANSRSANNRSPAIQLPVRQEPEPWRDGRRSGRGRYSDSPYSRPSYQPSWTIEPEFRHDVFTFARVEYTSAPRSGGRGRGGYYRWDTDHPDSDNNFSYRLHELTSLRVDPQPVIVQFDDESIHNYPFVYLVEAGHMALTEAEVKGMRNYLLRGGFLMVDDFWGEWEYEGLAMNLRRVFPDRSPVELPISHEIFHIVYDINHKPMIPSIHHYYRGDVSERYDAVEAHYQGVFDDDGRMMMIICHNTDLGDGWEREGVDEGYFRAYSERWAYPLGINIVTYAMTH